MSARKLVACGLALALSLHGVAPASAAERRLPDGTRISVRVMEQISSASNGDVLALHQAGFGEGVILAKIAASRAAFSVDAADLVGLKKAGVSERVIAAMVASK